MSGQHDLHLFVFVCAWAESFVYKDTIDDMILWTPHAATKSNWASKTGLPFDPFDGAAVLLHQELLCPKCRVAISVRECTEYRNNFETYTHLAYITAAGTGYAQQNFSHSCPSCTFDITKERLAVAKLTVDFTAHLLHEPQVEVSDMRLFLP